MKKKPMRKSLVGLRRREIRLKNFVKCIFVIEFQCNNLLCGICHTR